MPHVRCFFALLPGVNGEETSKIAFIFAILQCLGFCPRVKAALVCKRAKRALLSALRGSESCVGCEAQLFAETSEVL